MKIIVKPHRIIINNDKLVNEREVNVSRCYFEFDKEITDDFVKEAYFTFKGNTYKQLIQNNECSFPQEVLTDKGQIEIGVVAYKIDDEMIRYNPRPAYFNTLLGSLKDDVENTEEITPTDKEQILNELANKQDTLVSGVNIKTINHETLLGEGNINITGGSGGTSDYEDLDNKPSINNIELSGNKSLNDLGIQPAGSYALASDIPTNLSELADDTTHRLVTDTEKTTWNNKSNFSGSYNDLTDKPTLFSGDYDDLTNKPSIPTKISDLTDDSNFLESTDLKTINGNSLVGSGDITISGGSSKSLIYLLETDLASMADWGETTDLSNTDLTKLSAIIKEAYDNGQKFFNLIVTSANNRKTPMTFTYARAYNIQTKPTSLTLFAIASNNRITNYSNSYQIFSSQLDIDINWNEEIPTVTYARIVLDKTAYLSTTNRGVYTPTSNYHPATKKYVDDSIASAITTTLNGGY